MAVADTADLNLISLVEQFHDEERCREFLEGLRWPEGVACLRCGSVTVGRIATRRLFQCADCAYQFSATVGSVFQDSKLPLYKWFAATYLMCESKNGISSNQLKRTLGVTYKTAWFLTHRIRAGMADVVREKLVGIIEADETFVGGKQRFRGRTGHTGPVPGSNPYSNKSIVLGALARGGNVRFQVTGNRSTKSIKASIDEHVAARAEALYSDDWPDYNVVADENTRHESVNHSAKEYVLGDVHTNGIESVWSLLKRSIVGSFHQLSAKHLDAYLSELEWRFNNRENPYLFRDTVKALLNAEQLEYKMLVAE
ncbi:MAG: IS1595 family transposase [Dehalococcoidia bacterium]|nr:IS1595 family transposase [Dehalococcoidia bacterium]